MNELRSALRLLLRSPGYSLMIVGLLALGMGSSTIAFAIFDAVMLRPLPVRHPEELVRMVQHLPKVGTQSNFPNSYLETLRTRSTTLAVVFGETGRYLHFPMSDPEPAEHVTVYAVTPEYFEALGVPALHGRLLTAEDARTVDLPPAVLSYEFWMRRFNGDRGVVRGRTIVVNKRHFAVVGVMPRQFNGITVDSGPDIRIPFRSYTQMVSFSADLMSFELAGRLKAGVTRAEAEAEAKTLWHSTMADYYRNVQKLPPEVAAEQLSRGMALEPLERGVSLLRDRFGDVFKLLIACVGLLVLIVCSNAAGLLLARALAKEQEIAVRVALGATSLQLARQVLAETFWFVVFGSAGAFLVALNVLPMAVHLLPPVRDLSGSLVPMLIDDGLGQRPVFFLIALTILMTLVFSITPLIASRPTNLACALRASRSSRRLGGRRTLITLQIALCTFLLVGAGLFLRTFQQLERVDPGFDRDHIATFTGDLANSERPAALMAVLTQRVSQMPGVVSAAVSSRGLMRGRGLGATVALAGARITPADFLNASLNRVSLKYFDTMGLRIMAGRDFAAPDLALDKSAEPVRAIVNQAFVRRFIGKKDPLDQRFGVGVEGIARGRYEIVGVVSDAKYRSLREPIAPTFYTLESNFDSFVLNVRTKGRPAPILEPVRKTLAAVSPGLPFIEMHTMADEVDGSIAVERATAALASVLGAVAALLAGAGIYGLLAYVVTQRRREFGIRMALGAHSSQVGKLVVRQTLTMTLAGVVLGLAAALAASSAVRSLLFEIPPNDTTSFLLAALFVTVVSAAATISPVVRAMRSQPAETLRYEN